MPCNINRLLNLCESGNLGRKKNADRYGSNPVAWFNKTLLGEAHLISMGLVTQLLPKFLWFSGPTLVTYYWILLKNRISANGSTLAGTDTWILPSVDRWKWWNHVMTPFISSHSSLGITQSLDVTSWAFTEQQQANELKPRFPVAVELMNCFKGHIDMQEILTAYLIQQQQPPCQTRNSGINWFIRNQSTVL